MDKIRYESLTDKSKLDAQPELFIRLVPDKANKSLSIIDSGIGMTKAGMLLRDRIVRSIIEKRFFQLIEDQIMVTMMIFYCCLFQIW